MRSGVRIEILWDEAGFMEARISGWNGVFAGTTDVYLGSGQLAEAAARLANFPESPSDHREVMFGAFGPESAGGGVSLRFHCTDTVGHAQVEARIEAGEAVAGLVQAATVGIPVEPAAIDAFVRALSRMDRDRTGTAELPGAV